MNKLILSATLVTLLCLCGVAFGAQYNLTPSSNWISILSSLQPGDTATLAGGTYSKTAKLSLNLLGTAAAPILITGTAGQTATITQTNANQNIVDIIGGNYFTIQNLTFTGGSLGIRLGPSPSNIIQNGVLQYLSVHDTAETAISANFAGHTYDKLTFRRNEVYNTGTNTGECFYLGCSSNACYIKNSVVVNNLCHDTLRATSGSVGSAIQIKEGSFNNLVQDNVCYNLGGPCVLLYTDLGKGRNRVIGNVVLSSNDNGIQAAAGATIINNIVLNTIGDGISIIQNPGGTTIANITIQHNTVVNPTAFALRLTNPNSALKFVISNNAFYKSSSGAQAVKIAGGSTAGVTITKNGIYGTADGPASGYFPLAAPATDLASPSTYNVYPKAGSQLLNKGDAANSVNYDFNYKPRPATSALTVGAYQYDSSAPNNPGWAVTKGFKPTFPLK